MGAGTFLVEGQCKCPFNTYSLGGHHLKKWLWPSGWLSVLDQNQFSVNRAHLMQSCCNFPTQIKYVECYYQIIVDYSLNYFCYMLERVKWRFTINSLLLFMQRLCQHTRNNLMLSVNTQETILCSLSRTRMEWRINNDSLVPVCRGIWYIPAICCNTHTQCPIRSNRRHLSKKRFINPLYFCNR